eukprot:CAMPEP_0179061632 /NCGR_PEP_ID=MMETSP0796-20121207/26506_1 /TAXON_ID=73915 /ORGANISM="Pyrodinium bahamense, Strain pbaha01" /LENGTH=170 /DNA_ID=CAMNT_0020758501 /DNA_START=74 /DNA_END=583 /DNA_ORIENTATION=-
MLAPAFNTVPGAAGHAASQLTAAATVIPPAEATAPGAAGDSGGAALSGALAVAGLGLAARSRAGRAARRQAARAVAVVRRVVPRAEDINACTKQAIGSAASAVLLAGSVADSAVAYPIFAQQNYANPQEATGKLACANCHLQGKGIDVRMPQQVLPDTIFKTTIEIPAKY